MPDDIFVTPDDARINRIREEYRRFIEAQAQTPRFFVTERLPTWVLTEKDATSMDETPSFSLDTPLKNYTWSNTSTRPSDIKRLLEAIHNNTDDFVARVELEPPKPPQLAADGMGSYRIKSEYTPGGTILKVFSEPTVEWEQYDKWTNKFVSIPGDQVPSNAKKQWLTWLIKWNNYTKSKGSLTNIKTSIQDYLTRVMQIQENRKLLSRQACDRFWVNQQWWDSQKYFHGITQTELSNVYEILRRSPGVNGPTPEVRNERRRLRRRISKEGRFDIPMSHSSFLLFLGYLYEKKYKKPWNITAWFSAQSTHVEVERIPLNDLPKINETNGAHFVPRYIDNGLVKCCISCDKYNYYDKIYNMRVDTPEGKKIIAYLIDLKTPKPPAVVTSKSKSSAANEIDPIIGLKPSNYVTETIRKMFIDSFLGTPKESTELPQWISSSSNYINYKKHTNYKSICMSCFQKHWGLPKGFKLSSNITNWGRDKIYNYTDNPIKYYPPMNIPGLKNPYNVGTNEQRKIVTRKEKIHIDNKVESYLTTQGLIATKKTHIYSERETKKDVTLYMGVELEVTPSENLRKLVSKTLGVINRPKGTGNNLGYFDVGFAASCVETFLHEYRVGIMKSDASVHGGFEIVTVPGTLAWHKELAWHTFFKENYKDPVEASLAPSSFLAGWINNGEYIGSNHDYTYPVCGIHVHVSKDALTQLQLGKIINFVGDNSGFITRIAGRNSERYAPFKKKKISDGYVLNRIGRGEINRTGERRGEIFDGNREAVNVNTSGKPTVEFRMFRSNVSKSGFFKNLEFVHALVTWCGVESSANKLTVDEFILWVQNNRGSYENFYKWLIKNGYLKSKHKENPEFIERKVIDLETKEVTMKKIPNPGYVKELEDAA